jgi:hypothetical protein
MVPGAIALLVIVLLVAPLASSPGPKAPEAVLGPATHPSIAHSSERPGSVTPSSPAASAEGRLIVAPSDPKVVPNDGLQTNITAFSYLPIDPQSSFQMGAEEVIGTYEAVFGIFDNAALGQVPFFDVFSNQSVRSIHLAYGTHSAVSGEPYEFDLRASGGGSWTLRVNGQPIGEGPANATFDFGAATATWAGGVSFSEIGLYQNLTDLPEVVTTAVAFQVHQPGGWYLPTGAKALLTGSAAAAWGVEGRAQHPTLAPDEIRSGTAIAEVPNGTDLWTGGTVPVRVGLALSTTSTVATLPVEATITVRDFTGLPIPDVPVNLTDALAGPLLPAPGSTGSNGTLELAFRAANVSAPSHDLVTAAVAIAGYVGSIGIGLALSPAVRLFVNFSGPPPTIEANATTALLFQVDRAGQLDAAGVAVAFVAGAGGALAEPFATSGPAGVVAIPFVAGPEPMTVEVWASVDQPGYWGQGQVGVQIVRTPPSLLDRAEPWIGLGVVVGVIAVPAALVLGRWREQAPIPELHLPARGGPEPPKR